jgi:ATP-dependent RNA helicase RhlE
MPGTVDAYTHRIGRTGRINETGEAFTFVCADDKGSELALKRTLGEKLKYCVLAEFSRALDEPTRTPQSRPGGFRRERPRRFAAGRR